MSKYMTPLIVKHLNGRQWEVMQVFKYKLNSSKVIRVPKGYRTDFASIPKIAWPIIGSPTGKHGKAAVIHDYLYGTHEYTRERSDKIFYNAMKVSKVSYIKRKTIYYAVRLFGGRAWRKAGK